MIELNEEQKIELGGAIYNHTVSDMAELGASWNPKACIDIADIVLNKIQELESSERPTCLDKNGKLFGVGDVLKNEKSTATVEITGIEANRILTPERSFDRQDFIDAGWIVHEPVTPYKLSDDEWTCLDKCKFKPFKIGSIGCIKCDQNKGCSDEQRWVICELYNQKSVDSTALPVG